MNEKEKAEAYVRSKCPELMELSFGCKIWKFEREMTFIELISYDNGSHSLTFMAPNKTVHNGTYYTNEIEKIKIIGHPIELQHYLQILDEIADKQKVIYRLINCRVLYFGKAIVKFHQKTGQPEDEEDWKAFNQILGI